MPIQRLQPGDAIPTSTPRRFVTYHGYIVLRWLVSKGHYVEVHEHRLNAGMPPAHLAVHHINGNKIDNRPENLSVLTQGDHMAEHVTWDTDEAARLYADGWTYPKLADRYGMHSAGVMRVLKRRGLVSRLRPQDRDVCVNGHPFDEANTYHARSQRQRQCRACNRARQRTYARAKIAKAAVVAEAQL